MFPETWVPVLSVPEHSIIMNNRYLFTSAFMCIHAKLLQLCLTLCNPVDCSQQASLSMGFSGQEYWSRLPCPPPGDLPNPGIQTMSLVSPALAGRFFTIVPPGKPHYVGKEIPRTVLYRVRQDSMRVR